MTSTTKQLYKKALALSPMERAEFIENLFESFNFEDRKIIDALWAKEVEDRIEAYEKGILSTVSSKEVFDNIERNK